ncbi:hypothetical protein [Schumannella sp. 10F1B-5-1]|uniref:tetratricopeptide repeat protein n=1 Tax=Schumannella sp. 10F1B-5-1 TaxID=2590780 RepID=UPI00113295AF|nr:hypothetical protein [Schumannella sp. 10F1B-5-1]TPW73604.1 hypothetical protein FJ658_05325 [Schumannella sp. 10F1B-5-1]
MVDPSAAFGPAKPLLSKLAALISLDIRVGFGAWRRMRRKGKPFDRRRLNQVLAYPDFRRLLVSRLPSDIAKADELFLSCLPPGAPEASMADLRRSVELAYLASLAPSASVAFKDELETMREQVASERAALTSNDAASFESRLRSMRPIRAKQLREIRAEWPRIVGLVGLLDGTDRTDQQISDWSSALPDFLAEAPASVFAYLADLANDRGLARVSISFIERASAGGADGAAYWAIRKVQAQEIHHEDEAARELAAYRGDPLVEAFLGKPSLKEARANLANFQSKGRRAEIFRRWIQIHYLVADLLLDEAIDLAQKTIAEFDSSPVRLLEARARMSRSVVGPIATRESDQAMAREIAIRTRDEQVRWGVVSGPAAALALRISRLTNDQATLIRLSEPPPLGEATASELQDEAVLAEIATLHAQSGDMLKAKSLIGKLTSAGVRSRIEASIADREGRDDDAILLWQRALDSDDSEDEKPDIALQLAMKGVASAFLEQLAVRNPQVADEIREVARLFAHEDGALDKFRITAASSARGAAILATYLRQEGDQTGLRRVVQDAARQWSDAGFWLEASQLSLEAGEPRIAMTEVSNALASAPSDWSGRRLAFRRMVHAASAADMWQEARNAAIQLLAVDVGNPSAVWALVSCELHINLPEDAFATWKAHGRPQPYDEMSIGSWIELRRIFGDEVGRARDALKIVELYPKDEAIRRGLIGAFVLQPVRDDSDSDSDSGSVSDGVTAADAGPEELADREDARALLAGYFADFPDGAIRQIEVDLENPLQSLLDAVGERPDTSEFDAQVARGTVPLGMSAEVHGKGYLEVLLMSLEGPRYAGDRSSDFEDVWSRVEGGGAVIDASALVTLALLPELISEKILGAVGRQTVITDQQRDAISAVEWLTRQSGTIGKHGFVLTDPAGRKLALARRVVELFSTRPGATHGRVTGIVELAETEWRTPFLAAVDYAADEGRPVWADERPLRAIARAAGVSAFDTVDLLHGLHEREVLGADELQLALATLVANGYAGIEFDSQVWDLAATLAISPVPMINAVKVSPHDNPELRARSAMELAGRSAGDPTVLEGSIEAAATWIVSLTDSKDAARENLELLLLIVLGQHWLNSSTLPFVVRALRNVAAGPDGVEVLLRRLYKRFEFYAERVGDEIAAAETFELVSRLEAADGTRIRAAVLTRTFDRD